MAKQKKQSISKKLLNWLKPTSPAKGMLLFAIAFAVIGGSFMAYRSFAASYEYDDDATEMGKNSGIQSYPLKAILDPNTYASKNGTWALDMHIQHDSGNLGGMDTTDLNNIKTDTNGKAAIDYVNKTFSSGKVCAVSRAPNGAADFYIVLNGTAHHFNQTSTNYQNFCVSWSNSLSIPVVLYNKGGHLYLHEIRLLAN